MAGILALAENGERLMPLAQGDCCSQEALRRIKDSAVEALFPSARAPRAALAGLYLYFSCRDEAHEIAQADSSADGGYWHGIVHRQEPAQAIAAAHPDADLNFAKAWDPFSFIDICERARRQPGSELERASLEIQRAEWQRLFDYCARRSSY